MSKREEKAMKIKAKIKENKYCKNQKGFTLAEIIVAIAITGIIGFAAIFAVQSSLSTYTATADASDQAIIYNGVVDYLMNEFRYSSDVQIGGTKPDVTYKTIEIDAEGGLLITDGITFPYDEFFYQGNLLEAIAIDEDNKQPIFEPIYKTGETSAYEVSINLGIRSENNNTLDKETVVKLLNMQLNGNPVEVISGNSGNIIHYKK